MRIPKKLRIIREKTKKKKGSYRYQFFGSRRGMRKKKFLKKKTPVS